MRYSLFLLGGSTSENKAAGDFENVAFSYGLQCFPDLLRMSLKMLLFPLVLQGLPCRVACSRWGGGSRGAVSIGYRVARKACFPKVLQGFRVNRVRIRVRFFWPRPKTFVLPTFLKGFETMCRSVPFLVRNSNVFGPCAETWISHLRAGLILARNSKGFGPVSYSHLTLSSIFPVRFSFFPVSLRIL